MKNLKFFFVLFFLLYYATAFSGGKKLVNSKYNWIQCIGIPNISVSGLGKIGNTLIAGAFVSIYVPYAYIVLSTDDGVNWNLTDSLYVYNHQPGTTFGLIVGLLFSRMVQIFLLESETLLMGIFIYLPTMAITGVIMG